MRLTVFYYLQNEDFSPEYAEANHGGRPTENNILYHWEEELAIRNELSEIVEESNSTYTLQGEHPQIGTFSYDIPHMHIFELHGEDGSKTRIAFSESLHHRWELKDKDTTGQKELHIYLKDYEVYSNPTPGVYIDVRDLPAELKR